MIEAVTSSVLSGGARKHAPDTSVASGPPPHSERVESQGFVTSYIRVDNQQNVAILEYRSENGEVKEQYPSKKGIEAFRQAERLQNDRKEVAVSEVKEEAPAPKAAPAPTVEVSSAPSDSSDSSSVVA